MTSLVTALIILAVRLTVIHGHGYLTQPAGRGSAWRFVFPVPPNYNDMGLFCGGFSVQWNQQNDGRCGACGDAYSNVIKPHEDIGGKYVAGVITGEYKAGDVMEVKVLLTAYHRGWFEFRLCPLASPTTKVTQACLNQTILSDPGTGTRRFYLENIPPAGSGVYTFNLQLPAGITCTNCVLQWWYNAGNNYGCEGDHLCGLGHGKQESYRNCADIKINPVNGDPTNGNPTNGDPTDGDPTNGDPTGGDPTDGDPTDGDPTDGDPTDGDPTGGDPTDGDPTDGDPTNGDPTGGDPTDGDPTDGDPTGGDPTNGDSTGGDPINGDPTDGDPTSGDPTDGEPCVVLPPYDAINGIVDWCIVNCNAGYCPAFMCSPSCG